MSAMSEVMATVVGMEAIAFGDEADARLRGLMAIMSLPVVRDGKVDVEIKVKRAWEPIDAVLIEPDRVTFSRGVNGHAHEWTFFLVDGVPPWRTRVRRERLEVQP